jgi:hypothetical protein
MTLDLQHPSPKVEYNMNRLQVQYKSIGGRGEFGPVIKAVTFSSDTSSVALFTVTGDVIVKLIAICKTNVASVVGCNAEVGIADDTNLIIVSTDITALATNEIWHDAAPDTNGELLSTSRDVIISNGEDILMTLSAQADSGAVTFYVHWTPLSTDGNVVAA